MEQAAPEAGSFFGERKKQSGVLEQRQENGWHPAAWRLQMQAMWTGDACVGAPPRLSPPFIHLAAVMPL